MYYLALASDYDGTLAHEGGVPPSTLNAIRRLKETGRKFLLVTGRELPDLMRVFPDIDICDLVVAENGALLYFPRTKEERPIAPAPPQGFVDRLREHGVEPISVGHSIVATWTPHETAVLETIQEMGLELQIIFNKGAVMVLPAGVNKASGLAAALDAIGLSAHNVAAIGDAENDHAFLRVSGFSVAVANALPAVKDSADLTTRGARGEGVEELVDLLVEDEAALGPTARAHVPLGKKADGETIAISPRSIVLIAGSSGIGKSTLAKAITEKLAEAQFQFVVFDPEGDYEGLENAVTVGDTSVPPVKAQIMELLANPRQNVVVNTLALQLGERPAFFADLMPELVSLRATTGRPHWLLIDEAHHLMPRSRDSESLALSRDMPATVLITVHPEAVSADALQLVDTVFALGPQADRIMEEFCTIAGEAPPAALPVPGRETVLYWHRRQGGPAELVEVEKPHQAHLRHTRKYAEGNLDEERSFYFRGPAGAMNLRVHNLVMFCQVAEGIDDTTWMHHLRNHDYSAWFRGRIADDALAEEAEQVEADPSLDASASRHLIIEAVRRRYTAPASAR